MGKIDLTPFIREDNGSEVIIDLPCKENERAFSTDIRHGRLLLR